MKGSKTYYFDNKHVQTYFQKGTKWQQQDYITVSEAFSGNISKLILTMNQHESPLCCPSLDHSFCVTTFNSYLTVQFVP